MTRYRKPTVKEAIEILEGNSALTNFLAPSKPMNLLTATSTLLDAVKTYAPEDDSMIQRAVKRMEKRLDVLRLRAAKALKRNRVAAFWDAAEKFGWEKVGREAHIICTACKFKIGFGDFLKNADFDGRGHIKTLACAKCGCVMEGK